MDFKEAPDIETVFEYAKAEVHDGDILLLRVLGQVPDRQLRAFRRSFYEMGQEHGFKERNIMTLIVNADVTIERAQGPLRVRPRQFDVERAVQRAMTVVSSHIGAVDHDSNVRAIMRAVLIAVADEFELEEDGG